MERTTGSSARSSAATRERLLNAAEVLFAERGFAGTSLRAATERAGANVAAVNYHFRSKEGLLRAVISRAVGPVNERRRQLLDDLEEGGATPTVEQLVRAFVSTGIHLIPVRNGTTDPGDVRHDGHNERGEHTARFIGRVMSDPSPQMRTIFSDEVRDVEGRYKEAVVRALPHLSRDEAVLRHAGMIGLLGLWQSGALPDLGPVKSSPDAEDRLVTFLVAGFHAPATPEPGCGSAPR